MGYALVKHPQRKWPANTALSLLWRGKSRDGSMQRLQRKWPCLDGTLVAVSQPRSQISLVLVYFVLCLVSSTCISLSAITLLLTRVNVPCSFSRICVSSLIASSNNGNGDGNENGKKAIGLFSKRQLCTCITLLCRICTTTTSLLHSRF